MPPFLYLTYRFENEVNSLSELEKIDAFVIRIIDVTRCDAIKCHFNIVLITGEYRPATLIV